MQNIEYLILNRVGNGIIEAIFVNYHNYKFKTKLSKKIITCISQFSRQVLAF